MVLALVGRRARRGDPGGGARRSTAPRQGGVEQGGGAGDVRPIILDGRTSDPGAAAGRLDGRDADQAGPPDANVDLIRRTSRPPRRPAARRTSRRAARARGAVHMAPAAAAGGRIRGFDIILNGRTSRPRRGRPGARAPRRPAAPAPSPSSRESAPCVPPRRCHRRLITQQGIAPDAVLRCLSFTNKPGSIAGPRPELGTASCNRGSGTRPPLRTHFFRRNRRIGRSRSVGVAIASSTHARALNRRRKVCDGHRSAIH
jgi:hypothetical protein